MTERRRLTKRTVDALRPGEIAWDSEVKGFGVRCQRRDRVYVLKTLVRGRQRWFSIGPHGSPWTVETARDRARAILGEIASGADPASVRDAERNRPTVKQLGAWFLEEHAAVHKKPLSYQSDARNLRNHVEPLLGDLFVADVTRADVDRFKRAVHDGRTAKDRRTKARGRSVVRGGPGAANRCLALLSKMFNWAEQRGHRPQGSNPCRHVEKYAEGRRERFLSSEELAALARALVDSDKAWATAQALRARLERAGRDKDKLHTQLREAERKAENPYVVAAIRFLLFSGARLGEVLGLKWAHVDLEAGLVRLPDSKTGQKVLYLNAPLRQLLDELPRIEGNPFVICGEKDKAGLVNLQKPWRRIRARAGLEDVRIHDLRHTFASSAAAGGLSLPMIGRLLGHTSSVTTERYAHLADDPVRAANEAVALRIAAAMKSGWNKGEKEEVVTIMSKRS